MCKCKSCVLCVFLCICVYTVTTFNVDSFNYASYEIPYSDGHNSMFGFSVALHRERNIGWLIVGAPEAQTNQPEVIHGGAVYKCPVDRDGGCTEIPFDTKGHNLDNRGNLMDNKTEQWFGATVSSSGREDGPIVACAPRYTWFPNGRTRRDPVGTCYTCNGFFSDFNEYSPCRTYQWGYHRQGSCQAGFSSAINKVGDRLFIGSPGSWYWQGQMYSIDAHARFAYKPTLFSATYGHEGQVTQQSLESRPAVFSTTEGTEKEDNSYLGYSTITGDFLGNGEEGIAVGMPRGNDLKGNVVLFTWNLTNFLHHFTSDQIGSYFGYALAASDVDGDAKLDLIVGAPMYTVQNNENKYDVGRVYVIYHQSSKGKFVDTYVIDGLNSKSRFGQTLASLGDINQDGYGDFAVGAPYDGTNNRGAVYIYHGSSKGVLKKFSQVILAEDVIPLPTGALTTFGFSITGGLDLDGNQYPDMAVGAYLSNKAFFFRSRPVIKVEATIKFLTKSVDIVNTDYNLRSDASAATKTQIQFCSKYYGKEIPESLNLGVEYILDTKKLINPRMGFVDDEGQNKKNNTVLLYRNQQMKCAPPMDVYVRSDIRDKLTNLVVEAKYWLLDDQDISPSYLLQRPRDPRSTLTPVLDLNSPPSKKDSISIQKNCGSDNICIPNLDLQVEPSVQEYYLDSGGNFFLDITVSNSGEDAFEATVEVKYPDGFFYSTSTDVQVVSHVLCSSGVNNTITCDIGNPVPFNKIVHFKLSFQPDYSKELPSRLFFDVSTNSTNQEPIETLGNNKQRVGISILYDVIQEIRGWSIQSKILFSKASSLYAEDISNQTSRTPSKDRLSEDLIGPQVIHVYELKNGGKTPIKATEIFFVWPATTLTGEDFFYLVDPPHFSFTKNLNLKCGPIPANYRDFELSIIKKSIWDLYDISVLTDPTTDKVVSIKDDKQTHKIGATEGGKIVKSDENLNKAVELSGDSTSAMNVRHHNKTERQQNSWQQYSKVQVVEAGDDVSEKLETGNFKHLNVGGRDFVYRCFRRINGREQEVDCGTDSSFSRNTQLLQLSNALYQDEGNLRYWCLEQAESGNWRTATCGGVPKLKLKTETKKYTRVQVVEAGGDVSQKLESGNFKNLNIGGRNYVYRCFRRINGREQEVDCGTNSSFSKNTQLLQLSNDFHQDEGNIQFWCLEQDEFGKWKTATCGGLPELKLKTETKNHWNNTVQMEDFSRIQIFQGNEDLRGQLESDRYRQQYVDGRNFIYRCFRYINRRDEEVDCRTNLGSELMRLNHAGLLSATGVQDDGQIRYLCFEPDGRGNLRNSTCGTLPQIRFKIKKVVTFWKNNGTHHWNNTGVYVLPQTYNFDIVQILQGGPDILHELTGDYNLESVNGQNFLFRCFKNYKETECGTNFSLRGINVLVLIRTVAIHRHGNIRYFCLETYGSGIWRSADCTRLPTIQTIEQKQTYQVQQRILRRCLKLVNGRWAEADCRSDARYNTGTGGSTFVEECFQTVNGVRQRMNCTEIPPGAILTDLFSEGTQQQLQNQVSGYDSRNNQQSQQSGGQYGQQSYGNDYDYNYDASRAREQQQRGGDPHTYGSYDASRNRNSQSSGIEGVGQGRGFTAGVLDLGSLEQGSNAANSEFHKSESEELPLDYNNIGDNVPTSAPSSKVWHHGRRKRQIVGDNHPSIAKIKEKYPCNNLGCVYMRCTIENLKHEEPLTIALRGRLNAKVLRSMKLDNGMQFSSMMLARVHKVPHLQSIEDSKIVMQEVETVVETPEEIKSERVPLWVVVLSAVAGTIILLLLIFLLYKLGFFKRNRPSSAPERQPLNRNGYHHGDEAL